METLGSVLPLATFVISVVSMASMVSQPRSRWVWVGRRKWAWVLAQAVGLVGVGIGLIIATIYFVRVRPQLVRWQQFPYTARRRPLRPH